MELCNIKNQYDKGTLKLSPNVKADLSFVESNVLACVHPDDLHHMVLVLNYCATTIGRKHKDIKTCIFPTAHRETGEMMLYTVYVSLPLSTVFQDEHFIFLRSISEGRIERNIKVVYDEKANPPMLRMEIVINALKNIAEIDVTSIIQIYIKKKCQVNRIYDNEADDDLNRGGTKRTRFNAATNST